MIKNKILLYLVISILPFQLSLPCFAMNEVEEDNQAIIRITARITHYRTLSNALYTSLQEADDIIAHLLRRAQFDALNPRNPDTTNITRGMEDAFRNYQSRMDLRNPPSEATLRERQRFVQPIIVNPNILHTRQQAIAIVGGVIPGETTPLQNAPRPIIQQPVILPEATVNAGVRGPARLGQVQQRNIQAPPVQYAVGGQQYDEFEDPMLYPDGLIDFTPDDVQRDLREERRARNANIPRGASSSEED